MGTAIIGFSNHPVATHQEAMAGVGERHIQGIRLGFQVDRFPRAGTCRWDARRNASTQAYAEHEHQ